MVDVAIQPVQPQYNPSPFPIPRTGIIKENVIAKGKKSTLQAWGTNLLIVPKYRGLGYSTLLMLICEYIAKTKYMSDSIHLHCDADPIDGKIAQQLYINKLGYQPLINNYANDNSNSIVIIEGVPLLYLYKQLN